MYKSNCIHSSECGPHKDKFGEMVISEADRLKPIIREQLLRKYILGTDDTYETFRIYRDAFNIEATRETRMILIRPAQLSDTENFFLLKAAAEQILGADNILLSTIIGDHILMIAELLERGELAAKLNKISDDGKKKSGCGILAVYSVAFCIADAPSVYKRLRDYMGYPFYSDSHVLYEREIKINKKAASPKSEYKAIENAVQKGGTEELKTLLNGFFDEIRKSAPLQSVAKACCLELYVCMIRGCSVEKTEQYTRDFSSVIYEAKTLSEIHKFIEEKGMEIAKQNSPDKGVIYSSLIRDTVKIIDENLGNENLSLRWLAGTILYTNVDYLGKLFKKETGKNFSHYVMEKRMEMAKELIIDGRKDKIYEIAEKVGYGSNSQYFSQVFKKYTGVSPLEYKEFVRLSRGKANGEKP